MIKTTLLKPFGTSPFYRFRLTNDGKHKTFSINCAEPKQARNIYGSILREMARQPDKDIAQVVASCIPEKPDEKTKIKQIKIAIAENGDALAKKDYRGLPLKERITQLYREWHKSEISARNVSERTLYVNIGAFDRFADFACKDSERGFMDSSKLRAWAKDLKEKGLTQNSISSYMRKIKAMFKRGLPEYYSAKCKETIKSPFQDYHASINSDLVKYVPWQQKDRDAFIKYLDNLKDPTMELICKVALFTGCRMNEIDKMKLSWIYDGKVNIPIQDGKFKSKNNQPRYIPLLFNPLEIRAKIPDSEKETEFLIPNSRSHKNNQKEEYRCLVYFRQYCRKLKKDFPHLFKQKQVWHIMRKEFVSAVVMRHGVFIAARYAGHSVTVCDRVYGGISKPAELDMSIF